LHRWVPHLTVSSSSVEGFAAKNLFLAFSRPLDELMHPPSVHPVLKPSKLLALCLELKYCRMNHCLYVGSSGAEDSSLGTSLSYSNWSSDRPTTPTDGPSVHLTLLILARWLLLLLLSSFNTSRKWIVGSSDSAVLLFSLRLILAITGT
jgi:hypothetical protein